MVARAQSLVAIESGMSDLALKWARMTPNDTNLGLETEQRSN